MEKEAEDGTAVPGGAIAKKAWNNWLEERDRAPAEVLTDWLKERTLTGLEVAKDYAKGAFDIAKSRADVARAGGALLDSGGEAAREAVVMKQQVSQAVAADAAVVQALRYLSKTYGEEAAFQTDPDRGTAFNKRGALYRQALEALGEPPEALGMTPVERDASAIIKLEQAAKGIGRPLSLEGGGSLAALIAGSYTTDASPPASEASKSRDLADARFEELLRELFRLHDLNGDGSIAERELIKLNEKIVLMHHGHGANKNAVREKFSGIFRRNLDSEGRPVGFEAFREHTLKTLVDFDPCRPAQEIILEHFVTEAKLARAAFHHAAFASITDAEFLPHLEGDRPEELRHLEGDRPEELRSELEERGGGRQREAAPTGSQSRTQEEAPDTRSECPRSPLRDSSTASQPKRGSPEPKEKLRERPESQTSEATVDEEADLEATGGYATNDVIEVWSSSKSAWLEGKVLQAFPKDCEAQGYSVPAGTLKVTSSAGTKWIRPGQAKELLRHKQRAAAAAAAAPPRP